jgi:tetratricopeptide (TPR) repeat protein
MTRVKSIAIAISLALGTVTASSVFVPQAVQAAEPGKLSKAVAAPLQRAQKAMGEKDFDTALVEIQKAQAVEKKEPHEVYQIDEFLGYVLLQQKKYLEAAAVYERMLEADLGLMSAEQVSNRTKAVAQIHFQEKEYRKAVEWAKRWMASYGLSEDMGVLAGQGQYLLEEYKDAADTMTQVIDQLESSNQQPNEGYYQVVISSYSKMNDRAGVENALKRVVRYYPKPNYWESLLETYRRKSNSERVTFGFYRLMNEVGVLKDKGDYMEMAHLGIEMGVPGESQQIMQKGMDTGVLKSDDKAEQGRYERLFADAKKQADADRASLAQQAKEAEKAAQGQADVGMGEAYLSYGQIDEAITSMERGIKKGGVTDVDEAQISLGIAYLEKGQKEQAQQAFKNVKPDSRWADLAELWAIYAQSPGVSTADASAS